MGDAVMVVVAVAFFCACVAYVGLCDRIIGPDDGPAVSPARHDDAEVSR